MPLHIVGRDLVSDALIAQGRDKPIEQDRGVPVADGRGNAFGFERFTSIVDKGCRAGDLANPQDQVSCLIDDRTVLFRNATARIRWLDGIHRGHIIATSLRCASLSPSMYRWVV
jgi:hypothetical protein